MPTLEFKGKQHVYAHHLTVSYRPLEPDPERSCRSESLDDNLIIHGDNLHALKALLPRYAGRIKCIYIDPPYNTGNEGWIFNDRMNSPLMKSWLAENAPVDGEDLNRHDKWLCMMWPRLHLLRELLADDGVIFVSIDDNEQHHLRMLMDEIFGEANFINAFAWISNLKGRQISESGAARTHEYVLAFARNRQNITNWTISAPRATQVMPDAYRMADYPVLSDTAGSFVVKNELHNTNSRFNEVTCPNLVFDIYYHPGTGKVQTADVGAESDDLLNDGYHRIPPKRNNDGTHRFHAWRWSRKKIHSDLPDLLFRRHGDSYRIYTKIRDFETTNLKDLITNIHGSDRVLKSLGIAFPHPKPLELLRVLIRAASSPGDIILDSFAGSGTTAHAVLSLNREDGGNRRFLLVECEDYADTITARRVRRAIEGVPGAKDATIREGLGGSFTWCRLGNAIDTESLLAGSGLPSRETLAAWLLHTASGISVESRQLVRQNDDGLFYADDATAYYLLYEPDAAFLSSRAAMLNADLARRIRSASQAAGKKAIVFAPGKYISQADLRQMGITFCQLPYDLLRS